MKAAGQVIGGIAAMDAGKFTRKVMRVNERHAIDDSVADNERIRYAARKQMGAQLVDQGSSGFTVGTGSALDELKESAVNRELDILARTRRGSQEAQGYRAQGAQAYAQGYSGMVAGVISGAATLAEQIASAGSGGAGGGEGYGRG